MTSSHSWTSTDAPRRKTTLSTSKAQTSSSNSTQFLSHLVYPTQVSPNLVIPWTCTPDAKAAALRRRPSTLVSQSRMSLHLEIQGPLCRVSWTSRSVVIWHSLSEMDIVWRALISASRREAMATHSLITTTGMWPQATASRQHQVSVAAAAMRRVT